MWPVFQYWRVSGCLLPVGGEGEIEWGFVTRRYITCDGLIYKSKKTKRSSFFVHSIQSSQALYMQRENRATIMCQVTRIFRKNEKKTGSSG